MPSDQNSPQNQNSTENPSPVSPSAVAESYSEIQQEPTEPALENSTDLGDIPPSVPVEGLGADGGNLKEEEYHNIPLSDDSTPPPLEKTQENQAEISEPTPPSHEASGGQGEVFEPKVESEHLPENQEIQIEPASPPADSGSHGTGQQNEQTGQIPVNDPLTSESEAEEAQTKPISESRDKTEPTPKEEQAKPVLEKTQTQFKISLARELLIKARNSIQFRKRKKLDRVMSMFLKQSKITNDQVEKLLHVSDKTAERYLNILEKENRVRQIGKTGKGVHYVKI